MEDAHLHRTDGWRRLRRRLAAIWRVQIPLRGLSPAFVWSIEIFVDGYPDLARALLECGDPPGRVSKFLRVEYGLEPDQADAAIRLARQLIEEAEAEARPRAAARRRSLAVSD